MPEIDASWQSVRGLMPDIQDAARRFGATEVQLFAQALPLSAVGSNVGICYGMSLEWLLARREGRQSAITTGFFMAGHAAEVLNPFLGTGERNDDFMRIGTTLQGTQNLRHIPVEERFTNGIDYIARSGLVLRDTCDFDQHQHRMRRAATFIVQSDGHANSYCMVNTPNHALAVHKQGDAFAFFDPNFGEFEFDNAIDFQAFFTFFLKKKRIVRSYAGKRGGRQDNGPRHKTLHLSIDLYA